MATSGETVEILVGGDFVSASNPVPITGTITATVATHIDDAAFTPGTDDIHCMGAMFDDVTPDSVDEGDAGVPRMSANRNLYMTIRDAAGNERGVNVDASNQLAVADAGAIALLTTIDADTSNIASLALESGGNLDTIAGDTTSIDAKLPALGTAAMAASIPVTLATDDTLIVALDAAVDANTALLTTIDADTSKIPSQGTAVMTGSTPVTIATDDTMLTALDAAVDIVAGDTTSLDAKTPALGTAAMAASSPVTIATDDTMMTALDAAVDTIAGAVSGSEMQVDVVSSALPTGAATEATLATIDADTSALAGAVSGSEVQVDVVAALPAGTNLLGKVTVSDGVNDAGINNGASYDSLYVRITDGTNLCSISNTGELEVSGDGGVALATEATLATIDADTSALAGCVGGTEVQVDVVSSALPTGAATEATLATIDADTSALAGTVSGSELQVDIVSSALPTGAATEATLATIDADTSALAGTVSGSEVQVDVVAALPAGTNAIGKLAANSGVDIGDVDVTSITGMSSFAAPTITSVLCGAISLSANTANQSVIAAQGASTQIWVMRWSGSADTGDGSISWQDEDDTAHSGVMEVLQGVQVGEIATDPRFPIFKVATNKALEMDTVTCGFKGSYTAIVVSV